MLCWGEGAPKIGLVIFEEAGNLTLGSLQMRPWRAGD